MTDKGILITFSGPSGSGKDTVLNKLISQRDDTKISISMTTRKMREGEIDGVHYYFVSKEQFRQMIAENSFLEYDAHMDNYYGTPRQQLEEKLTVGSVILDIEPNGAFAVRKNCPDAVLIFIAPPSMEELENRLRSRGDTSDEQIEMRLKRAEWEMDQSTQYDYVVINDQVEACAEKILNIIAEKADKN